ncbi:pyridoxamine 5'-phosphate oxidase family protein [Acuticoccus sediminis]|nr:pyridoxamine 5'-phosphate oxidase family protein [Acuticoccus sediminis]
MTKDEIDLVWREISRIETCMMVTQDGSLVRARPMVGVADRSAGTIWFVTSRADHKDDQLRRDPRVCLSYVDTERKTYVSVSGKASLLSDRQKIEELWTPNIEAWFDRGPDDPAALLIAVRPEVAEVWDDPNAELIGALELLTASSGADEPGFRPGNKIKL